MNETTHPYMSIQSGRVYRLTAEQATMFGGLVLQENAEPEQTTVKATTKTTRKTNSSKEGK